MDRTNQILTAIAAIALATGGILATLGHRTLPYLLIALSALLAIIIIGSEAWQRRTAKADLAKNVLRHNEASN